MNYGTSQLAVLLSLLADAGVPMIFLTFPLMLFALVPVVLLEVWIAKSRLQLSYARSAWVIALANAVSTIIGVPVAWGAMFGLELLATYAYLGKAVSKLPSSALEALYLVLFSAWLYPDEKNLYWQVPVAAMVLLIPTFFLSWYIEAFIVDKLVELDWPLVRSTMLRANLASYALLYVASCGWLIYSIRHYKPR